MTEPREYPRYIHRFGIPGPASVIVNDGAEEAVQEAIWAGDPDAPKKVDDRPVAPTRYSMDFPSEETLVDPEGDWVRWEDIASMFRWDVITDEPSNVTNMLTAKTATNKPRRKG